MIKLLYNNSPEENIAIDIINIIKENNIKKVEILSPYISDNRLLRYILESNIDITLIFDFSEENLIKRAIDINALDLLLKHKGNIILKSNNHLHSKLYLLDNKICILGSANFTYNGLQERIETMMATDDKATIGDIATFFKNLDAKSTKLNKKNVQDLIDFIKERGQNLAKDENKEIIGDIFSELFPNEETNNNKIANLYDQQYNYPKTASIQDMDIEEFIPKWDNAKGHSKEKVLIEKVSIIKCILEKTGGYLPTKNITNHPKFGEKIYNYWKLHQEKFSNQKGFFNDYINEQRLNALEDYLKNGNVEPRSGDFYQFIQYFGNKKSKPLDEHKIKFNNLLQMYPFKNSYKRFREEYFMESFKKQVEEVIQYKEKYNQYPSNYIRSKALKNSDIVRDEKYYKESRLAGFLAKQKKDWQNLSQEKKNILEEKLRDYDFI